VDIGSVRPTSEMTVLKAGLGVAATCYVVCCLLYSHWLVLLVTAALPVAFGHWLLPVAKVGGSKCFFCGASKCIDIPFGVGRPGQLGGG
jgi:hypothetical protein